MAKNSIRDYDATSGNNTDIQSIDISEGCAASGINNALREVLADLKDVSTGAVALETPAADRLDVDNIRIDGNTISSTDTNGDITLDPDGTGDTIIASGNVGIGTTSPDRNFQVETAGDTYVRVSGNRGNGNDLHIGNIEFENTNGSQGVVAEIKAITGSSGTQSTKGQLAFYTDDGSSLAERLRVDQSGNVGIGTSSPNTGISVVTGSANGIELGQDSDASTDSARLFFSTSAGSNAIHSTSGAMRFFTGSTAGSSTGTERMRLTSGGYLNLNTTSTSPNPGISMFPSGKMILGNNNSLAGADFFRFHRNNVTIGSVQQTGTTGVSFNTSSDHRLKEAVVDMTGAITRVKQLAPKRFNFIADDSVTVDGFLAHEAQAVVPEAVTGTHNEVDDDGNAVMQGIDQSKLVPLLTAALKESIAKIETLETQRADLETRLTALENA